MFTMAASEHGGTLVGGAEMRLAILAAGLAATAAILSSGTARADASPSGIEVGLRSGYAIPLGSGYGGHDLSAAISGAIPIWIDAGYRFLNPNLFLGAYFQDGIGLLPSAASAGCGGQSGVNCSETLLMYGVQAHFHFAPYWALDPWLGVAFGFENLNATVSQGTLSTSLNNSGLDYVTFTVGADYKPVPNCGVGPFVSFALGEYNNASTSGSGNTQTQSGSIPNPALHEWLVLGIRVAGDINL
jgi:hypothetical protein